MLNKDLQSIFPSQFEDIQQIYLEGSYNANYFIATKNSKKGILDLTGNTVVDFVYDDFVPNNTGYRPTYKQPLVAIKNNKQGMIDLANKVIIPFEYDYVQSLNSFLAIVGKKEKFGVMDIYNQTVMPLPMEYTFITHKPGSDLVAYKNEFKRFHVNGSKITPAQ